VLQARSQVNVKILRRVYQKLQLLCEAEKRSISFELEVLADSRMKELGISNKKMMVEVSAKQ
jgi:hypothetical protein